MKELKNYITTYFNSLSDRDRILLILMVVTVFFMGIYLTYHFSIKVKIDKLNKNVVKYEKMLKNIQLSGEIFLQNSIKNKRGKLIIPEEDNLYSLLGSLARKHNLEIKTINEKPIPQKSKEIVETRVQIYFSGIMLDNLSRFMADVENMKQAPVFIFSINIRRDYSDKTKINARLMVDSFYKKRDKDKGKK